jgi:hypothetical protein
VQFVAPEIDPPADLIPAYVPEGYKLISGFQLDPNEYFTRLKSVERDDRVFCEAYLDLNLIDYKSPEGAIVQGVHYVGNNQLLLITKSSFPGGTLEDWQSKLEGLPDDHCECEGIRLADDGWPQFRDFHVEEFRAVGDTRVAVLSGGFSTVTVFIRGDYLITVEGSISLEENLKIVESLLKQ